MITALSRFVALRRGAAQDRAHTRDELARVERLRHVVVGADLEADDLVDVLVARRQHQDRQVAALTDALADLDAVDVRQHQVEHDERRLLRLDESQCLGAARGGANGVAGVLQIRGDERCDRRLILDDEHRLRLRRHAVPYPFEPIDALVESALPGSETKSSPFNE